MERAKYLYYFLIKRTLLNSKLTQKWRASASERGWKEGRWGCLHSFAWHSCIFHKNECKKTIFQNSSWAIINSFVPWITKHTNISISFSYAGLESCPGFPCGAHTELPRSLCVESLSPWKCIWAGALKWHLKPAHAALLFFPFFLSGSSCWVISAARS